jgi:hypothetical protein
MVIVRSGTSESYEDITDDFIILLEREMGNMLAIK